MTFSEVSCPHCGGKVKMNSEMSEGICEYCGHTVINNSFVRGKLELSTKDIGINSIRSARVLLMSKDDPRGTDPDITRMLNTAQSGCPELADVWYLNAAVILCETSKINGEVRGSLEEAHNAGEAKYFTEQDYITIKNRVASKIEKNPAKYVLIPFCGMLGFMAILLTMLYVFIDLPIFVMYIFGGVFAFMLLFVIVFSIVINRSTPKIEE